MVTPVLPGVAKRARLGKGLKRNANATLREYKEEAACACRELRRLLRDKDARALRNWIERAEKASGPLGALAATVEEWKLEIETYFLPDAPPAPLKPLTAKSPCSGAKLAAMLTNTTSSG